MMGGFTTFSAALQKTGFWLMGRQKVKSRKDSFLWSRIIADSLQLIGNVPEFTEYVKS